MRSDVWKFDLVNTNLPFTCVTFPDISKVPLACTCFFYLFCLYQRCILRTQMTTYSHNCSVIVTSGNRNSNIFRIRLKCQSYFYKQTELYFFLLHCVFFSLSLHLSSKSMNNDVFVHSIVIFDVRPCGKLGVFVHFQWKTK